VIPLVAIALASAAPADDDASERIALQPGKSVVLALSAPVSRTVVTAEQTARVFALDERTLLIQGVAIGTTDLVVTYAGSTHVDQFDLAVQRDVTPLRRRIEHIVRENEAPKTAVH
jgi:Flp pilus assembly secretin CpaC